MKKELLEIVDNIEKQIAQLKSKINILVDGTIVVEEKKQDVVEKEKTVLNEPVITDDPLKVFVDNPAWTAAVQQDLICDENNHEDKMDRARGIRDIFYPNFAFENKKILDFGTGYGHLVEAIAEKNPSFVVGYDIKDNFQISSNEKKLLTTSWDEVVKNGPYDLIYIYDVVDHVERETPQDILNKAKSVVANDGIIRMRCHPYISRHGGHVYTKINKSYVHLILTKEEMEKLGHDFKNYPTIQVTTPQRTYAKFIADVGLRIIDSKTVNEPADGFFLTGNVSDRIKMNMRIKQLLIPQMGMQFLDYTLSK